MSARQSMLLTALVLCGAGTGWFLQLQSSSPSTPAKDDTGYDSFVRDMTLRAMNTSGTLKYHVRSELMTHFPDAERYELEQPRVHFLLTDGTEWNVRSDRGETTASGNHVWLLGSVDINRPAKKGSAPLRVETSNLLVKPDSETAETAEPARITSDRHRVDAVGFSADFKNQTLELHSQVRGRIDGNG